MKSFINALIYLLNAISLIAVLSCNHADSRVDDKTNNSLLVFCGAASKPPMDEIISEFEKQTKIKVFVTYGGSGYLLSQILLTHQGDVYVPGSSDFMDKAQSLGVLIPNSEKKLVYLIPEICVAKGNPKNIHSLRDLVKPGIKIGIGNPEQVCVGTYAVEIIEKTFSEEEKKVLRNNIVNYAESCEKTANLITFNIVDAVIGWDVFQYWDSSRIESIKLKKDEIIRIGYIPAGILKYSKNRMNAQRFIDFLSGSIARSIFKKYHYYSDTNEVFNYLDQEGNKIGKKPIGGVYLLPKSWTLQ
ncbi:MAG: ABC transporter substrate-binding protein [Bacteroidia bacterium]|nr:MAG: ABC transporter substrate-binding protein [Bacteroidia bacterium]